MPRFSEVFLSNQPCQCGTGIWRSRDCLCCHHQAHTIKMRCNHTAHMTIPIRYVSDGRAQHWGRVSINFKDTTILANMTSYMDHFLNMATEIQVNHKNFKRYQIPSGPVMVPGHKYNDIHEKTEKTSQERTNIQMTNCSPCSPYQDRTWLTIWLHSSSVAHIYIDHCAKLTTDSGSCILSWRSPPPPTLIWPQQFVRQ